MCEKLFLTRDKQDASLKVNIIDEADRLHIIIANAGKLKITSHNVTIGINKYFHINFLS